MLEKTIQFHDLDGNVVEETFYFHYSKAELIELNLEYGDNDTENGYAQHLQKVLASGDKKLIIKTFKDFLVNSVGMKHSDGRRFTKSDSISAAFAESEAYVELFMSLFEEQKMIEFMMAIMPADIVEEARKQGRIPGGPKKTVELPLEPQPKFNPNTIDQFAKKWEMTEGAPSPGSVTPLVKRYEDLTAVDLVTMSDGTRDALLRDYKKRNNLT